MYKKLLFVYLCVIGGLIFLCNDLIIAYVPMSAIVLSLHSIYSVALVVIKPYKQSLRIHSFALYINLTLVLVDLVVINMINLF